MVKVERANQTPKRTLAKLCRETTEAWVSVLLTSVMRLRAASKAQLQVSPFELIYAWPFLRSDLLINEETLQLLSYPINLGQVQKALQEQKQNSTCP